MLVGAACGVEGTPRPPTRTPRPTITATFAATATTLPASIPTLVAAQATSIATLQITDLANGSQTPDATLTLEPTITPTRKPVTIRATAGQLEITNVLLVGVIRDPNHENGAIASVQVVYSGGRAPYTIMHDEDLVAGNPFPVLTVCNGTLIHTIKLTSGDRQVVTKKYFLSPVACPP